MSPPAALHRCPGRCGRSLHAHVHACTRCMDRLPLALRTALDAIRNARTGADAARRREVVTEARDWWLENPAPYDPDAAIAGECEWCHTALLWLTTASGARMPVDAEPDPERGNVVRIDKVAGVLGPHAAAAARQAGTNLWLHHVVTCPHADKWKSKPKPKQRKAVRR